MALLNSESWADSKLVMGRDGMPRVRRAKGHHVKCNDAIQYNTITYFYKMENGQNLQEYT